jgi:hypothetical protein
MGRQVRAVFEGRKTRKKSRLARSLARARDCSLVRSRMDGGDEQEGESTSHERSGGNNDAVYQRLKENKIDR